MGYTLEVSSEAKSDTQNAIDHYYTVSEDLSIRFLDELEISFDKIASNPQFYKYISKKSKNYRGIKLRSFPYIVIFRIIDDLVIIYSVFNSHRKPNHRLH